MYKHQSIHNISNDNGGNYPNVHEVGIYNVKIMRFIPVVRVKIKKKLLLFSVSFHNGWEVGFSKAISVLLDI